MISHRLFSVLHILHCSSVHELFYLLESTHHLDCKTVAEWIKCWRIARSAEFYLSPSARHKITVSAHVRLIFFWGLKMGGSAGEGGDSRIIFNVKLCGFNLPREQVKEEIHLTHFKRSGHILILKTVMLRAKLRLYC